MTGAELLGRVLKCNIARPIQHKLGNVKAGRWSPVRCRAYQPPPMRLRSMGLVLVAVCPWVCGAVWSQEEWFKKNLQDDQDLADQMEFDAGLNPTDAGATGGGGGPK